MSDVARQIDWLPAWVNRARLDSADDPEVARLHKASIAAPNIQPPALHDPRSDADLAPPAPLPANIALSPAATRPYAARPETLGEAMRLRPLSGFSWGGAARGIGGAAAPRVSPVHLLIWLGGGSLRIELPRLHHMQREGELAFIPAGTAFALWQGPMAEGEVLSIPPAVQRRLSVRLPSEMILGRPRNPDLVALRRIMVQLPQVELSAATRRSVIEQFTLITLTLSRLEPEHPDQHHPTDDLRRARPLTERYLALARRDLGRGLTIADLAQALGVTTAVLDRACRCCRGRSALELLYDLRLERAVKMLAAQSQSPAEIAIELGYVSLGHMNRAFVAATGRGPDYFRHRRDQTDGDGILGGEL